MTIDELIVRLREIAIRYGDCEILRVENGELTTINEDDITEFFGWGGERKFVIGNDF